MTFQSGHRAFDAAVNHPDHGYIGRGNVSTPTQHSSFIRALCRTDCDGSTFTPGQLRDADLRKFKAQIPYPVRKVVLRETLTRDVILYRFFHRRGRARIDHGWIVTTTDHAEIFRSVTGPTFKSRRVIEAAAQYICGGETP